MTLFFSDDPVACVDVDDLRPEILHLGVGEIAIAENDDPVTDNALSSGRAVQAYLAGVLLAGDNIGLEALSIIYIADHHLLIGKHARIF